MFDRILFWIVSPYKRYYKLQDLLHALIFWHDELKIKSEFIMIKSKKDAFKFIRGELKAISKVANKIMKISNKSHKKYKSSIYDSYALRLSRSYEAIYILARNMKITCDDKDYNIEKGEYIHLMIKHLIDELGILRDWLDLYYGED